MLWWVSGWFPEISKVCSVVQVQRFPILLPVDIGLSLLFVCYGYGCCCEPLCTCLWWLHGPFLLDTYPEVELLGCRVGMWEQPVVCW